MKKSICLQAITAARRYRADIYCVFKTSAPPRELRATKGLWHLPAVTACKQVQKKQNYLNKKEQRVQ